MSEHVFQGLTHEEAAGRLKKDGFNELPSQKEKGFLYTLLRVLSEPMLAILVATGCIYLLLGEARDAMMLSTFIFFVVGITFYQERKTEKAIQALKNLTSPRALVMRDGMEIRIAGREVVVGDIAVIKEGDRIPADARVVEEDNFQVDESIITGESLAVRKSLWTAGSHPEGTEEQKKSTVYSGTLVISGRAIILVFATGSQTQMGKIGTSLTSIADEKTLLHKETAIVVRNFAAIGLVLCLVVTAVWTLMKGNITQGVLAGLTLSMSMLPEEFPVVLTIFLTLGAWRLSKRQVLTRTPSAIETLGAATVLCVDKTGTLTKNKMTLSDIYTHTTESLHAASDGLTDESARIIRTAFLAGERNPFDPVEKEIRRVVTGHDSGWLKLHRTHIKSYPLKKGFLAVAHAWEHDDGTRTVALKGAPETVLQMCHIQDEQKQKLLEFVEKMARRGLRVLGVAHAAFETQTAPEDLAHLTFSFEGFAGFKDPIRDTVPEAVKTAYTAGIRIIMITGDYPGTAYSIAQDIGLADPGTIITGEELSAMDHRMLREKIKTANIFARVIPEQKLAIVSALKANGEVVVMTGDGVNDAPALKAAHIGIAMGERGTDVAREASDLVLTNDDFTSIVRGVKTGRKIYENIKKAMAYIIAVHVPIAGMASLPIFLGLPVMLMPAHIAFLELIIDPACSTVFESEHSESDIMDRPPRSVKSRMFSRKMVGVSLLQGISVLSIVLVVLFASLYFGKTEEEARTITFLTLVFSNLMLIITNLSWKRMVISVLVHSSMALRLILLSVVGSLGIILSVPYLRDLFYFSELHTDDILIALLAGGAGLLWFELYKFVRTKFA